MATLLIPTDTSQATLGYLLADGTIALTADWDVGSFQVTVEDLIVTNQAAIGPGQSLAAGVLLKIGSGVSITSDINMLELGASNTIGANDLNVRALDATISVVNIGRTGTTLRALTVSVEGFDGSFDEVTALRVRPVLTNTPIATLATAIEIVPSLVGGAGSGVASGILIRDLGASDFDDVYALRILEQTAGDNNTWGISQEGTTVKNRFEAKTRFGGTLAPTVTLDVIGLAIIRGSGTPIDLENTTDAASVQVAIFRNAGRQAPTDNDEIYASFFIGDDNATRREFGRITHKGTDLTATTMDSQFEFAVSSNNNSGDPNVDALILSGTAATFAVDAVMGDKQITGIDILTFTDTAGTIAGIQNQNLLDKSAAETITGAYTFNGAVVINEASADVDFRVEGDTNENALFVQGSDSFVGIGTGAPNVPLHVKSSNFELLHLEGATHAQLFILGGSGFERAISLYQGSTGSGNHKWKMGMDNAPSSPDFRDDFVIKQTNNANPEFIITTDSLFGMSRDGLAADPIGQLHIEQTKTDAALPVLVLDQRDVSEEGIKFTLNAASPTDADIKLFTVAVTGTPTLLWDESEDDFNFSAGVTVESREVNRYAYSVG